MGKLCQRGQEAAATAIQTQAGIITATALDVRKLDPEGIHDMRVASRRLRTALQIHAPFLPKKPRKAFRNQVKRITGLLGQRREFDVMAEMLRGHRDETRELWQRFMDHAIEFVDARREAQAEYCAEAADLAGSDDFQESMAQVLDNITGVNLCFRKLARKELGRAYQEARQARKRWKKSGEPEDLHRIRVKLKHLRYACEFYRDLYGEPMDAFIKKIKGAQGLLGEWNECRLLEDMVLTIGNAADYSLAQGAPLVAEAYGDRAANLARKFKPVGKAILGGDGRKAFEKLVKDQVVECCPKP